MEESSEVQKEISLELSLLYLTLDTYSSLIINKYNQLIYTN